MAIVASYGVDSELQRLLLSDDKGTRNEKEATTEEIDENQEDEQSDGNKRVRPGFRKQTMKLKERFMRCKMETKLFINPCSLRFVATMNNQDYEKHVFPLDCLLDFAHFRFKSYCPYPVRLRIWHRNPDGVSTLAIDKENVKEHIGIINSFGKLVPRGQRKPFQLSFLPWRRRKFILSAWESLDPRLG